jgi:hypothetical protein
VLNCYLPACSGCCRQLSDYHAFELTAGLALVEANTKQRVRVEEEMCEGVIVCSRWSLMGCRGRNEGLAGLIFGVGGCLPVIQRVET